MGCDIHLHVEAKIKGKWEHYSHPFISRNYWLFSRMAGVRDNGEICAIAKPRGLPGDISASTQFDAGQWGSDAHTCSWLSAGEAGEVQRQYEERHGGTSHPPLFGYLYGNDIDCYVTPGSDSARLKALGFEDARIVFWFDN